MALSHVLTLLVELERRGALGAVAQKVSMRTDALLEISLTLVATDPAWRAAFLDAVSQPEGPAPAEKPAKKRAAKKAKSQD